MMWLHFMLDLSGSSLLFVFFASPSFSFFVLIHPFHFTPCLFLTTTHFQVCYPLCIIITHLIINLFFFIASLLLSYSHWAPWGLWLTRFFAHITFHTWGHGFLIIGYLSLVSLHFCYPITLAYVMSRVLRPPWDHRIGCRLRQPLLGQVFEIWLIFGYHHASFSERRLFDIRTQSSCGFRWLGLHIWWQIIWRHLIFWSTTHSMPYWGIFLFGWDLQIFMELHAYLHLRGTHQDDNLFIILSWSPNGAPLEPFGQTHTFRHLDVVMLLLRDTFLLIRGSDSTMDLDYWDHVFDDGWFDVTWLLFDLPYIWFHTGAYFSFSWEL